MAPRNESALPEEDTQGSPMGIGTDDDSGPGAQSGSRFPAPGFRKFTKAERPYLPMEAMDAFAQLRAAGVGVKLQEVAVLQALCDVVDARHGQYYGSWQTLIARYSLTESVFFRWLDRLESHGLIENLGRVKGRTTTIQVLPHVYRESDGGESAEIVYSSDEERILPKGGVTTPERRSDYSSEEDTNILITSSEHQIEHQPYSAPSKSAQMETDIIENTSQPTVEEEEPIKSDNEKKNCALCDNWQSVDYDVSKLCGTHSRAVAVWDGHKPRDEATANAVDLIADVSPTSRVVSA